MHTPHQFLLISSPPFKEARFQTARKLYGSTFAFQWVESKLINRSILSRISASDSIFLSFSGSHIENWHSILRNGLISASYTKLQVEYEHFVFYDTILKQICQIFCTSLIDVDIPSLSLVLLASWSCIWERHLSESGLKRFVWLFWYVHFFIILYTSYYPHCVFSLKGFWAHCSSLHRDG